MVLVEAEDLALKNCDASVAFMIFRTEYFEVSSLTSVRPTTSQRSSWNIEHIGINSPPLSSSLTPFTFWVYRRNVLGAFSNAKMSPHGRLLRRFVVESLASVRSG